MKIVVAQLIHIPPVLRLFVTCNQMMRGNGIDQWDDVYPDEAVVTRDVNTQSMHVLLDTGDRVVATVCLNHEQDTAYQTVHWLGQEPVLVVHRLCVHPEHQGRGIGSHLMGYVEEYAALKKCCSIRLDAYTGNPSAINLYRRLGYRKAGEVMFPRRRLPFFCFEKILAAYGQTI